MAKSDDNLFQVVLETAVTWACSVVKTSVAIST